MTIQLLGPLAKMITYLENEKVHYELPVGHQKVALNELLGRKLKIIYQGSATCEACGKNIKKAYQQGFCFVATQKLAQCDMCILKPEQCHHHLGTCREPLWGEKHCFASHIIYFANSSGLKVGITREKNLPTRWLDQGAEQAIPVLRVATRRMAGIVEVAFKQVVSDKTSWQKLLKGPATRQDMQAIKAMLLAQVESKLKDIQQTFPSQLLERLELPAHTFVYPILAYPEKVKSFNLDKHPEVEGVLQGIKGQYLIFDTGVINIRKYSGYDVQLIAEGADSPSLIKPILRTYPYAEKPPCEGFSVG